MTFHPSSVPPADPIDLRTLSAANVAAIRRQTAEAGHHVFRNQPLGPEELERFVGQLGPLVFTPGEQPLDGQRFVFEVTNRERVTPPRSVYHSDTSYVAKPPAFTVLAASEVPDRGGETLIIDQYKTAQRLPLRLADEVANLELLHIPTRVDQPDQAGEGHWHPLLRLHPLTGKPALYLSARERLAGARRNGRALPGPEARRLIDHIHDHATSSVAPYRHRWRAADVLLIDNRCTLHAADHSAVEGVRTLHRVMCREGH